MPELMRENDVLRKDINRKVMELSDELYAEITKHSDIGEHYFEDGKYRKALEEYKKAFELIPEPKTDWEASVWTLAAIGDSHYMLREFVSALKVFEQLMNEYHEENNPFARVRYGECLYETGNTEAAREHLQAAFDMEGEEIFDNDKYLKFISGD
jgi:tetratricopeptide (TPR) repeat protein